MAKIITQRRIKVISNEHSGLSDVAVLVEAEGNNLEYKFIRIVQLNPEVNINNDPEMVFGDGAITHSTLVFEDDIDELIEMISIAKEQLNG